MSESASWYLWADRQGSREPPLLAVTRLPQDAHISGDGQWAERVDADGHVTEVFVRLGLEKGRARR